MAHAPKYNALEAYTDGRLSPRAEARILRHLRDCPVCQRALEAVQRYRGWSQAKQQEPVPDLSWERLERALDREAQSRTPPVRRSGRLVALAWPVMALAATFVLGWFALSQQRQAERAASVPHPTAQPRAPEQPAREGWVTLATARAELLEGAGAVEARPGLPVREGMLLRTGPGAELHVALGDGSAVVVEPESEVQIARLRAAEARLDLRRGSLFSQVRGLQGAERYEVGVDPFVASVRGTRFRVERLADAAVTVFEGHVVVLEGERLIADLLAGQRWPAQAKGTAAGDRRVQAAEPASRSWPTLLLPSVPAVTDWQIAGSRVPARAVLAMRVPPGPHELRFFDLRGKEHVLALEVAAEGAALDETSIQRLIAQQNEARGELAPEEIEPVVRGGLDALKRCYERSLRRDPSVSGKLLLAIRVAPDGRVSRASLHVDGAALPMELEGCIELEARAWRFPQPRGGSVAFEVPLNLKAGR